MELFSFLEPKTGRDESLLQHFAPINPLDSQQQQQQQQHYMPQQQQQQQPPAPPHDWPQQRPRPEQTAAAEGITFNFNRRRVAGRGGDVEVRVWLTFDESVRGCIRELRFRALVPCPACRGRGLLSLLEAGLVRSRDELTPCAHCHGTGTYSRRSALLTINSTCCHCNGHGYPLDQPCRQCSHGRLSDEKVLHIEVPQGVMHDMRMVYSGQGDAGEFGGEPGDLVVVFGVEESSLFQRTGDDVVSEVNVSYFEAALGATVLIRGIYANEIPLTIPAGTQPDALLCLPGEGFLSVCPAQPQPQPQPQSQPQPPQQEQQPPELNQQQQHQHQHQHQHQQQQQQQGVDVPSSALPAQQQQQQREEQQQQPAAFPHYQYRRRRRRASYQPPPDNGEKPAYRTINRTDYFNSLLQKSNFFSSTFLQQGATLPSSLPDFSLFHQQQQQQQEGEGSSSRAEGPGRESSVGVEDHEEEQQQQKKKKEEAQEEEEGLGPQIGSRMIDRSASTGDNGALRDDAHDGRGDWPGHKRLHHNCVDDGDGEQAPEAMSSESDGEALGTTAGLRGMAKEAQAQAQAEVDEMVAAPAGGAPPGAANHKEQEEEEKKKGGYFFYSKEAEAERRVHNGNGAPSRRSQDARDGGGADASGDTLEIRHTVVGLSMHHSLHHHHHHQQQRHPKDEEEEEHHKAKEEQRDEEASGGPASTRPPITSATTTATDLDAIDGDVDCCGGAEPPAVFAMDRDDSEEEETAVASLPRAQLLPRGGGHHDTTSPVVVVPLSPATDTSSGQRRGHMYIRVKVAVPPAPLTPRQTAILAALHQQWWWAAPSEVSSS